MARLICLGIVTLAFEAEGIMSCEIVKTLHSSLIHTQLKSQALLSHSDR